MSDYVSDPVGTLLMVREMIKDGAPKSQTYEYIDREVAALRAQNEETWFRLEDIDGCLMGIRANLTCYQAGGKTVDDPIEASIGVIDLARETIAALAPTEKDDE